MKRKRIKYLESHELLRFKRDYVTHTNEELMLLYDLDENAVDHIIAAHCLGIEREKCKIEILRMPNGVGYPNKYNDFINAACKANDIPREIIGSKSRKKELVLVRQYCFYILWHEYGLSLNAIGKEFGSRDHSTVIHGKDTVSNYFETKDKALIKCHNRTISHIVGSVRGNSSIWDFEEFLRAS